MFLYTSGSTGRPKGVVLSHYSHLWVMSKRMRRPGRVRPPRSGRGAALPYERSRHVPDDLQPRRYHRAVAAIHDARVRRGSRTPSRRAADVGADDDGHDVARARAAGGERSQRRRRRAHGLGPDHAGADRPGAQRLSQGPDHERVRYHRGRPGCVRSTPQGRAAARAVDGLPSPGSRNCDWCATDARSRTRACWR